METINLMVIKFSKKAKITLVFICLSLLVSLTLVLYLTNSPSIEENNNARDDFLQDQSSSQTLSSSTSTTAEAAEGYEHRKVELFYLVEAVAYYNRIWTISMELPQGSEIEVVNKNDSLIDEYAFIRTDKFEIKLDTLPMADGGPSSFDSNYSAVIDNVNLADDGKVYRFLDIQSKDKQVWFYSTYVRNDVDFCRRAGGSSPCGIFHLDNYGLDFKCTVYDSSDTETVGVCDHIIQTLQIGNVSDPSYSLLGEKVQLHNLNNEKCNVQFFHDKKFILFETEKNMFTLLDKSSLSKESNVVIDARTIGENSSYDTLYQTWLNKQPEFYEMNLLRGKIFVKLGTPSNTIDKATFLYKCADGVITISLSKESPVNMREMFQLVNSFRDIGE